MSVCSSDMCSTPSLCPWLSGVRDINSLNFDASLADLGLDSLMGVEIRQILERDYDVVMSMRDIRQLTINKLQEVTNNNSKGPNGIVNTHEVVGKCSRKCGLKHSMNAVCMCVQPSRVEQRDNKERRCLSFGQF